MLFGLERWQTLAAGRRPERRLRGPVRAVGRARHRHDSVLHQDVGGHRGGVLRGQRAAGRRARRLDAEALDDARARRLRLSRACCRTSAATGIWRSRCSSCRLRCSGGPSGIRASEPGGGSYIAQRMLASRVREGFARRRALLQHRALRAAAVAVDPRRARVAHRLSESLGHPGGVSAPRPEAHRARHRVSGDAEVPARRDSSG